MSDLNQTPKANRLQIGIFGKRNSGKSSLINALTGQDIALVSPVAGTTTDPVDKAIEIHPLGACLLIDTAGYDDVGELGELRVKKTHDVLDRINVAIIIFDGDDMTYESQWINEMQKRKIPIVAVVGKADIANHIEDTVAKIKSEFRLNALVISAQTGQNINLIKDEIARNLPEDFEISSITAHLVNENDVVMLVMPQDIQAPKGRLILPQVQTIRDLLDNKCIVISVTADKLKEGLLALSKPPKVIITDSQVFPLVAELKPKESMLTSFSVLFARYKGDVDEYIKGALAIDNLKESDKVLIAEACTHNPLDGDIGRIKLPALLRKKVGQGLTVDIASGVNFPQDLSGYSLIIHCGGCMFNRRYVLTRIQRAVEQNIPISNYGVVIAHLTGTNFTV